MDSLFRTGLEEYRKRKRARVEFQDHTFRMREIFALGTAERAKIAVTLLTPLISIAWTDGKLGRYEQDAIIGCADEYGCFEDTESSRILMERLTSRPHPNKIATLWSEIKDLFNELDPANSAASASHLYHQTKFIGELSEEYTFGHWRGHKAGTDELGQLAETERRLAEMKPSPTNENPSEDLKKVVPMVEVAWADGRVTKRERQMIFDSLVEMHIPRSEENLQTLANWLELRPDEAFFEDALRVIRAEISVGCPDTGANKKYDIISRCTLVAEASGGTPGFVGGGARICDEEIQTVKNIAQILNGAMSGKRDSKPSRVNFS